MEDTHKIHGVIPNSLFERLKSDGILFNSWDSWLAKAIMEKLEREEKC